MTEDRTITRFEGTQLIVETGNDREVYDAQFLVTAYTARLQNFKLIIGDLITNQVAGSV